ncbi:hypothetical protein ADU59_09190 [Pararhizobium polonicum]|uniref:Uncharacterized protein n=1 Tax=Pararhizobium polonicum TaxID=1612624 RepID=A0A1C7P2R3_9HYPH|nr:hypothetical protein [Pararhizobium polonicum]OBZ95563.1 hypothetical protein ADU59_09190 [Pararhizobium polonicum]
MRRTIAGYEQDIEIAVSAFHLRGTLRPQSNVSDNPAAFSHFILRRGVDWHIFDVESLRPRIGSTLAPEDGDLVGAKGYPSFILSRTGRNAGRMQFDRAGRNISEKNLRFCPGTIARWNELGRGLRVCRFG